ncbi:MAG: hypothetical protein ACLGHN_05265 [Bacteriovoracia bacterium]
MRTLLVIQKDDPYFLFETLRVIEKNYNAFKDFKLTLLVDEKSLKEVYKDTSPLIKEITLDETGCASTHYDISVNLSLNESSWSLHGNINSSKKLGPYFKDGLLQVEDLWSSYLLTLKSKTPFLTFHLQDIYKNILGIKDFQIREERPFTIREFAIGLSASHVFPSGEQELFIEKLSQMYPVYPVKDVSEVDLISDVSHTLYIGPPTLQSLKLCEAGAHAIFISSGFRGFNLLPSENTYYLMSSRGEKFEAAPLLKFIQDKLSQKNNSPCPYALYRCDNEQGFGSYLKSLNSSDDHYPFYQSHVVLWNFLLNLFDADLDITRCSAEQVTLLKNNSDVLKKVIRLHDYAMSSVDHVYQEAKSKLSNGSKIDEYIKHLLEIDKLSDQIASSHPFLRPVLDFYRIRRGQNQGNSLLEQAQTSLLTYSEEHQALQALQELFSVTLRKNEVNI